MNNDVNFCLCVALAAARSQASSRGGGARRAEEGLRALYSKLSCIGSRSISMFFDISYICFSTQYALDRNSPPVIPHQSRLWRDSFSRDARASRTLASDQPNGVGRERIYVVFIKRHMLNNYLKHTGFEGEREI